VPIVRIGSVVFPVYIRAVSVCSSIPHGTLHRANIISLSKDVSLATLS